jgi:sulfate adenylyltransferase
MSHPVNELMYLKQKLCSCNSDFVGYIPNKPVEAKACYGTTSIEHPAVLMITTERGKYYCGGEITGLNVPVREFPCKSPAQVRSELPKDVDVVAFQVMSCL